MIRYQCDRCGARMSANDAGRFIVKIEVYAAASPIDLDATARSSKPGELQAVIEQLRNADPTEVEDQTYRAFRFDLCDSCRKDYLARPLGRQNDA